jgi:hypothetical protein
VYIKNYKHAIHNTLNVISDRFFGSANPHQDDECEELTVNTKFQAKTVRCFLNEASVGLILSVWLLIIDSEMKIVV